MTYIYVKTWEEVYCDPSTVADTSGIVINHKHNGGHYNKTTHGLYAGCTIEGDLCDNGWVNAKGMWFASWTYEFPGHDKPMQIESFKDDYDAFKAWDNSIERRKREAYERIKEIAEKPKSKWEKEG